MLKVKRGGRRAFYRDASIRSDVCGIRNVMSINSGSKGQATHGATGNSTTEADIKSCGSARKVTRVKGKTENCMCLLSPGLDARRTVNIH